MYGSRIRPLATPLGKVKNGCRRFFTTTPVPMFGLRTPIDYYVCGAVGKDTNSHASTTKAQLINRIKVVFETLPRETNVSLLQVPEQD